MVHNIDAIYDQNVFRPIKLLSRPAGTRVHLRLEDENWATKQALEYEAWLEGLPGRWQGEFRPPRASI